MLVLFCRGTDAEKLKRPAISQQLNVTMYTHISSPCHSGTSIRLDLLTNSSAHTVGYVHPLQIRKGLRLHQHTGLSYPRKVPLEMPANSSSEQQGAAFTFSKCHKSQMKVRAREVSETRQESAWKWKRVERHNVNTDEHTSIQNLRELLRANYTKHTFRFRQSSEVDSLIKY